MRIAMIGQKGMPATFGGVERHVHDVSVRLASVGHTVTVYTRAWYAGSARYPSIDGVRIVYTPSIQTKHLDTITHTFFSIVHALFVGADIFHFHGVGPALLAFLPRLFRPKSIVITTFHSIDRRHKKWGGFARACLHVGEWCACKFSHKVISVCVTIRDYVRDKYRVNSVYIPNGVEVRDRTESTDKLAMLGVLSGKYVLAVSRFIKHKRLDDIIRGWKALRASGYTGVAEQLVLVGDGFNTDMYVKDVQNLADADPTIVFTGFQSGEALLQLYSHALCYVHASQQEGLPISVIEAMSYELPVVLSNIPEHADLVQDHRFLFGERDAVGMAKTLEWVLMLPEEKRRMFGSENKDKVLREFVWDEIIPTLEMLYTLTLGNKRRKKKSLHVGLVE